jgi:radical SAM superfamily enzyme YgiQ (UPF0313 family)
MKVCLIDPPTSTEQIYGDWDLSKLDTYCPPLGLLSIASYIRYNNHEPIVYDMNAETRQYELIINEIIAINPDIIGLSAKTISINIAHNIATKIKNKLPNIPIIIGGAHITALPIETLRNYTSFDYGIYGEAEITFLKVINYFEKHHNVNEIYGLVWRQNGKIMINRPRELIQNLDELPFPAWDLLSGFPHSYKHSALETKRLPAASIITSRGCPFQCTFCDRAVFGSKVRHHSAKYTINMINHLKENYGIKDLMFLDDNFLLNRDKLYSICDYIIDNNIDLSWYCMGHAKYLTDDRIKKIRDAGCWIIEIGIESGSDKILKSIKKNTNKAEIADAVKRARKAGLQVKGNFIFGFPEDTKDTIDETIEFAKSIDLTYFQQNFLTVWPGCEIATDLERQGREPDNWSTLAHQRITYVPEGMTQYELIEASKRAFREFYLRPKVIAHYLKNISSWRSFKSLLTAFFVFIRTICRS